MFWSFTFQDKIWQKRSLLVIGTRNLATPRCGGRKQRTERAAVSGGCFCGEKHLKAKWLYFEGQKVRSSKAVAFPRPRVPCLKDGPLKFQKRVSSVARKQILFYMQGCPPKPG